MDKRYEIINDKLNSLSKSTFRNSFCLKDKDKNYIKDKGMNIIADSYEGTSGIYCTTCYRVLLQGMFI